MELTLSSSLIPRSSVDVNTKYSGFDSQNCAIGEILLLTVRALLRIRLIDEGTDGAWIREKAI